MSLSPVVKVNLRFDHAVWSLIMEQVQGDCGRDLERKYMSAPSRCLRMMIMMD